MEWCCFLQPMIGDETTGDPEMECFLTDLNWAYLYPCEACECQTQEKILQNLWSPPAIEKRPRACALSPRGPIIRPPRFVVTSQLLVPKPLPQSPIPKPLHASCLSINPFSNFFQMRTGGFFTYFNYIQAAFPAPRVFCMPIVAVHVSWGVAGGGSSALLFSKIISSTRVTAISVHYTSFY